MITRQLDSEFGHEVTMSVEREEPQNSREFPLIYIGMWRRNCSDQQMWLSPREAQTLKRMLLELLCPEAFEALLEGDEASDDGAWPLSREVIRHLLADGRDSVGSGGERSAA